LALTKVNFRSLATNLNNAIKSGNRAKLEKFWANAGGNPSALIKSIEVGSGKKRLGGIGAVDPVTQAALITAASGLVLALIKQGLLPKEAAIPEGATGDDIDLAADQGDTTWDKVLRFGKEALKGAIVKEGSGGGPTAGGTLLTGGTIDKSGNITSGGNTGGINNTLLLGGAGVVAAIMLMRKR
jgi:hypothetical protein